MKSKKILALLALAIPTILASCGPTTGSEDSNPSGGTSSSSTQQGGTSSSSSEDGKYKDYKTYDQLPFAQMTYKDGNGKDQVLDRHLMEQNNGYPALNSRGEQRLLVVPLGLEDDTGTSPAHPSISKSGRTEKQTQQRLEQIEKLFFGNAEETGWNSLKSYYETSSHGKMTLTGNLMLSDGGWFRPGKKPSEYNSSQAVRDIKSFYTTEYAKANHGKLGADAQPWTWYDQDKDGAIDAIWIVYSAPIHAYETSTTGNNYWAYVTSAGGAGTVSSPNISKYAWASIDFMDQAYGEGKDGHTFIHETGHLFGNDDYYSYDDTEAPLGGIDMQDHNIGDHNAFTKWQFGWAAPKVVTENAIIEMTPTTLSDQFVILPSPNYNNTYADEYMMVEFMSPVGLNEEYKVGYQSTMGYTKPGLRITHVDARAYKSKNTEILDTPEKVATATNFRVMNTPSGRGYAQWRDTFTNKETGTDRSMFFINVMQASAFSKDNNLLSKSTTSTNSDLFVKGFSFDLEPYDDGGKLWNDWYYLMPSYSNLWNKAQDPATRVVDKTCTFDYSLEVLECTKDKVKFVVEKIER